MLKGRYAADTIGIGVHGGQGSFDTRRQVGLPESDVEAQRDFDLTFLSSRLRWSHVFEMQSWYVLPSLDLAWTRLDYGRFEERGAAGANLQVRGGTEGYFTVSPMVEVGGEFATAGGTLVRRFAKLGVDILRPSGVVLRVNYVGQFGDEIDGQGFFLRVSKPF